MALKSRKSILKHTYTLCLWMTISMACLWVINGINPRYSSESLKDQMSVVGTDDRKRVVNIERSLSELMSSAGDRSTFPSNTNEKKHKYIVNSSDAKPSSDSKFYDIKGNSNRTSDGKTSRKADDNFETKLIPTHVLITTENNTDGKVMFIKGGFDGSSNPIQPNKTHRTRRLPQALIIGVKKCGTRALLEYLRIHPDIRAPGPEPHFFDRYYHLGLDWYREKMPVSSPTQLTIEKTPKYFVTSEVPERVHQMSAQTKLIIVVRDPVTRAISDFTQAASKAQDLDNVTFERKAFKCNGTGQVNTHWSGINTGLYITHIKRWLQYFPYKNVHVVSGENLIRNPAQELESIQDFLNLTRFIGDQHFYFNETKGFPCVKKIESQPDFQCFNSRKGRPHIRVKEETVRRLKNFFKPYNDDFYKLIGRNFGW